MARKRAPGGGRKPRGEGPAVHFNTRIAPEIKRRLERDAKRSGRSLSREIELRLADAIKNAPEAGDQTRALAYLITQAARIAQTAERRPGTAPFDWRRNRFDFETFKTAVVHLLDRLAPAGMAGESTYADTTIETPEQMGRNFASIVLMFLGTDAAEMAARAESRGALSGSIFYAYPQAARDLGFNRE
jgi:TraY domain-containing protein